MLRRQQLSGGGLVIAIVFSDVVSLADIFSRHNSTNTKKTYLSQSSGLELVYSDLKAACLEEMTRDNCEISNSDSERLTGIQHYIHFLTIG